MSHPAYYLLIFLIWSLMGFIMVGVGIHTLRYQRKKEAAERALVSGRIVDRVKKVKYTGKGHSAVYYVAVVEFRAEGDLYRLENENGSKTEDGIPVGKSVDVMYDPADPAHFHLTDDDANEKAARSLVKWGAVWVFAAAALTALCAHFGLL